MAAPNNTFSYGHDLFGDFQIGLPRQTYPEEAPPAYSPPRSEEAYNQPLDVASLSTPITEIAATTLRQRSCVQCRGQRYDYTAYFHNNKIFSRPPHELLKLVEESYVLKTRLQSLLVNYALRDIPQESLAQIRIDLEAWEMKVNNLTTALSDDEVLAHVRFWASRMMRQLWEHVAGVQKMGMPPGRAKELVSEFRKLWEAIWVRCVSMKDSALPNDKVTN